MTPSITPIHLGLTKYSEAVEKQLHYHELAKTTDQNFCLFVEHPPVITIGKNASMEDLNVDASWLKKNNIDLEKTTRGGKLTVHEPGQLVVYPILRVRDFSLGARTLIEALTKVTVETFKDHGLKTYGKEDPAGVWVGEKEKIASIGIRISNRVSYHGIAINLSNDMNTFRLITPCGLTNVSMTTFKKQTGHDMKLKNFSDVFFGHLTKTLEMSV